MFERLKTLLQQFASTPADVAIEQAAPMAAAMLLLEVAWADHDISAAELAATRHAIEALFGLTQDQIQALIDTSKSAHDAAISMYPFTRAINDSMTMDEKRNLILLLWRLAGADAHDDVHEEHMIRRIADLVYVDHQDFIAAKRAARGPAAQ